MFSGAGTVAEGHADYPAGKRYELLAFVRQPIGQEHDWVEAARQIERGGFVDCTFERAGTLSVEMSVENLNSMDECLRNAYEEAANGHCGLIVYNDPKDA